MDITVAPYSTKLMSTECCHVLIGPKDFVTVYHFGIFFAIPLEHSFSNVFDNPLAHV